MSNLMQGFALHTPTDNSASTTTLTANTTNDNNMPMGAASSPSSSLQVSSSGEVYYPGSSVQQYGGSAAATAGVAGSFNGQQYRNNNNDYVNFNQFMMQHNFFGGGNGNGNSYQVPNAAMSEAEFNRASGGAPLPQQQQPQTAPNYFNYENNYSDLLDAQAYYGLHQQQQALPMKDPYPNPFAYTDATSTSTKNANPTDTLAAAASFLPQNGQNIFSNFCTDSYATFGDSNAPTTSASNSNYYSNPFAAGFDLKASKLQASAEEFVPRFDSLTLQDAQATAPQQNGESLAAVEDTSNQLLATNSTFDAATSNIEAVPEASTPSRSFSKAQTTNNNHNNNTNNGGRYQKSSENAHNGHTAGRNSGARQRNSDMYDDRGREDRYERGERGDRFASERYERGDRNARGNRQHRYDNHRQNKRRDDWNRNRDRINGFRVDEKYGNDNGSSSPLTSPEKKSNNGHNNNNSSPKATGNQRQQQQQQAAENEKLSQREKLIRDIETRRLECLVCVETIGPYQSIWSCRSCYHIMHLQCIIKWASSSKSEDGWRCPACQNIEKEVPRDYFCFCGKVKNPHFNRQDTAHSCGEVCGRIEGCPHACTLLCHPGPCPPCQANVKRECGCGKTTQIMQCCLKKPIACDAICEKLLNCELHTCTAKCHEGKCEPCAEKVEQHCHCGKNERQVTCTRDSQDKRVYSCGKPCGKDLACGNHKCKDCCHAGECRPCKMSPDVVTSCPCGKMPVLKGQRSSCLDVIPTCEGVCNKTLRCGKASNPHHCTSKCHLGNCPPCNKQTAVKCRCGHMDQMIKCRLLSTRADDARCKKRCTKKRSCGKHKCNQECCIDIDHICPLPCNYTLSCGKHKCDQPCHRGNCPPCYRSSFEELYCECGAEVIYPPVPCGTKRPVCRKPCSRSHPCDHPPQHTCHSAATCPPCMILTTKWCFGKHEQRKTIPCSQESFSCGLPCNKPLPCGRHKCVKPCHEGPCQAAGEVCKQSCVVLRATCGHKCMAACHDGECPDTPCKETVEVQCECGNRKQMRACHDLVREFSRIATAQLASSMAEMQRGNYMELNEILQPVKLNKTNKTLDCNEECRLLERNRRLAIGLQVRNPDVPQKLQTKYSDFIRTFYKRDPTLVKNVHDALTTLVKLAKESKQKSRSHSFPTMNREKRQLVHEMCEMFGVDSVAYDKEPNRNVVATAFRDRSWLPAASIMEIMAREAGHRRVPVPSNNAWGLKR